MPTYEYKCLGCDTITELNRDVVERDAYVKCDECDNEAIRIYTAPGIQFKGTGFYKTGG